MLILRLYIDESWPDHQRACDWALIEAGRIVGRGRTASEHWPTSNDHGDVVTHLEIVLDPAQYSLHDITLPPRTKQSQYRLIGYALEDRLLEAPERYHFVVAAGSKKAERTRVIAILATRLAHILASLKHITSLPGAIRAVPMHELLPPAEDTWLLWQTPDARLLVHGQSIGSMHIERPADLAPLLAAAGTNAPTRIRLIGQMQEPVVTSLPVVSEAPMDWASGDWRNVTNLLMDAFRPANDRVTWKSWRNVAAVAGLLFIAHTALTIGEWIWLANREKALKAEIAQAASKVLAGEPAIAPLAQLISASDRVRHQRGEVGHGDYLALVRIVAEVLDTTKIEEIHYGPGRIEFRFQDLAADREKIAREAFARAGLEVRVNRGANGVQMLAAWMIPGATK